VLRVKNTKMMKAQEDFVFTFWNINIELISEIWEMCREERRWICDSVGACYGESTAVNIWK
jgi:hypothetical protein